MNPLYDCAEKVNDQFIVLSSQARSVEEEVIRIEKTISTMEEQYQSLLTKYEVVSEALEVMKYIMSELSKRGLKRVEQLVTQGLQAIFFDRDFVFEIKIDDRGKDKTASFYIDQPDGEGGRRKTRLEDSEGHGVQIVVSFILRVFFIMYLKKRRFLAKDEALTQLNERYFSTFFEFVRALINKHGFDILAFTQDTRFLPYADAIYRMTSGSLSEVT